MSAKHSVQASTSVMGALRDGLCSAGGTSYASGIHDFGNISFISTKSSAWILATSFLGSRTIGEWLLGFGHGGVLDSAVSCASSDTSCAKLVVFSASKLGSCSVSRFPGNVPNGGVPRYGEGKLNNRGVEV